MTGPGEKFTVGVARCASYDPDAVGESLGLAISRAGGLPESDCGEALVKTNLLSPTPPEMAVTTHPELLRALAGEIKKSGKTVHIADNPGYIFTNGEHLLGSTGINTLPGDGVSVGLLSDRGVRSVKSEAFRVLQEARISSRYLDAPYVVNAAKLKTHVETEMTGCVKNIFGTADTATRKKCHAVSSTSRLAEAITDLFVIRPPEFNVMDAVISMEGDGPSHGRPRETGWIIAGRNALAVDWVAALIMCYSDPLSIPLMRSAASRGMGPRERLDIELVGALWSDLPSYGFKKSSGAVRLMPVFLRGLAHRLVSLSPMLEREKCVRCSICSRVCPVDAISGDASSYPVIKKNFCVKCLCCHEMCPTGAMRAHKNMLARLIASSRS